MKGAVLIGCCCLLLCVWPLAALSSTTSSLSSSASPDTLVLYCGASDVAETAPLPSTTQAEPPAAVPEPSTLILMGLGLLGLMRLVRRPA